MLRFAFRRVLGIVLVLFVAVVLTFGALQFVPGDPILILLGDQSGDAALEARLRSEYGLDRPLTEQFSSYLGGVVRGDFGLSFRFASTPVKEVIATGLAISPVLALTALVLAVPLGIGLGTFAARRKGTLADSLTMFVLVLGISIPNFALAAFLVYLFAVRVPLLPVAGWGTPAQVVLPLVLLVVPPMVYVGRLTRTYMLEILQEDYIRTARAKGLRERLVIYRHAHRNMLVPLSTSIGIIFGGLLSGTFRRGNYLQYSRPRKFGDPVGLCACSTERTSRIFASERCGHSAGTFKSSTRTLIHRSTRGCASSVSWPSRSRISASPAPSERRASTRRSTSSV